MKFIFFPFAPVKNDLFLPVTEINSPSYVSYLHVFSLFLSELFPTLKYVSQVKRVVNTSKKQKPQLKGTQSPTAMTSCLVRAEFGISLFVLEAMKMDL